MIQVGERDVLERHLLDKDVLEAERSLSVRECRSERGMFLREIEI